MGSKVGLNKKEWAQVRKLLGMGWDSTRIARLYLADPKSLEVGIKEIRDKGLIIKPPAGTGGVDVTGLKAELRAEIMADLEKAGIVLPVVDGEIGEDGDASGRGNEHVGSNTNMSSGQSKDDGFDYASMREPAE